MPRPDLTRVPEWFQRYTRQVVEDDLLTAIRNQTIAMNKYFQELSPAKRDYKYGEDKWTIKQVLQHIIDAERIFSYRALRFARKDATPLATFNENDYAANAKTENRNWDDLVEEFNVVRRASEIMFSSFDAEQLEEAGIASDNSVYVLAIGFIIVGHANHHLGILRERYV